MIWQQLSKAQLRGLAVETFREGGGSRPDVFLLQSEGKFAVLKDHDGMDRWFAKIIGPLLAWREAKAMRRLEQVSGIPSLIMKPDSRSLLMEYIPARQVVYVGQDECDSNQYIHSLQTLIELMHDRGVAHGDLRSPTNALIDDDGNAALVDLVASVHRGAKWNVVWRYVFDKMCLVDLSAVTKLKKRIAPELLGKGDIDATDIAGKKGMAFRQFGQWVRMLSRKLFTSAENKK